MIEGSSNAFVLVMRRDGLVACVLEHAHPLLALLLIRALDPPSTTAITPWNQFNTSLTELGDVIGVELVSSVASAVNGSF